MARTRRTGDDDDDSEDDGPGWGGGYGRQPPKKPAEKAFQQSARHDDVKKDDFDSTKLGRKKKKASLNELKDRDLKEQAESGFAEHDTDYGESGQVLLYPKENNATGAEVTEADGNATTAEAEAPKASAFKGTARSLN